MSRARYTWRAYATVMQSKSGDHAEASVNEMVLFPAFSFTATVIVPSVLQLPVPAKLRVEAASLKSGVGLHLLIHLDHYT